MPSKKAPQIPLPKSWNRHVRSAMLHVILLAQYAVVYNRSWAVDSHNGRVRLKAEKGRLLEELARKNEKIRIKGARMARITPHRRPHYPCVIFTRLSKIKAGPVERADPESLTGRLVRSKVRANVIDKCSLRIRWSIALTIGQHGFS